MVPFVKKFLRILRWYGRALNQVWSPSKGGTLCYYTACMPMKQGLELGFSQFWFFGTLLIFREAALLDILVL